MDLGHKPQLGQLSPARDHSRRLLLLHNRDSLLQFAPGLPVHRHQAQRLLANVHPPHCHSHAPQLQHSDKLRTHWQHCPGAPRHRRLDARACQDGKVCQQLVGLRSSLWRLHHQLGCH